MIDWRTLDDGCHHYHNIQFGESAKFLGAWIQKVVPCSQLPAKFMGKIIDQDEANHALKLWYELESVYLPDRDGFKGCGWVGKGDNQGIEKTSFGGQEGCGDGEIYKNGEFLQ